MNHSARADGAVLLIQRILAVLVLLLIWQAGVWTGLFPSAVPSVMDVLQSTVGLLVSPTFWVALGQTIGSAVVGWALAAVAGIVLGLLIGSTPLLERMTSIPVEFGRAFPIIALLPVVVLILGANSRMEIFMVALSCLWPILVQTIYGARRQDLAVVDTVRVFRIPALLRFRRVLLPAAMPFITTGLRLASSIAILVAVGIEVLSQTPGIGRQITLAQEAQRWDLAFAYLLFAGLVGWAIAAGLQAVEARTMRWSRRRED
ncbi:ABC transporter permease [Microbacterium sp.]|uniref:ABC transporter permease n=1 Tax=Microbacterium sp. TaxID=51671 RepID=UPI003A8B391C